MAKDRAHGRRLRGRAPKALDLGDGEVLSLEHEASEAGRSDWTLLRKAEGDAEDVSVAKAIELAGDEHADYVRTRTRAEIAWLRVVSEWFNEQAERLDRELAGSRA